MPVIAAVYGQALVEYQWNRASDRNILAFVLLRCRHLPPRSGKADCDLHQRIEYAANIRFVSLAGNRWKMKLAWTSKLCLLTSTTQSNGNDYYDGDIRVLIFTSGSNKNIFSAADVPGKDAHRKPTIKLVQCTMDLTPIVHASTIWSLATIPFLTVLPSVLLAVIP